MLLTVQDLKNEFGLEDKLKVVLNGNVCQGSVQVFGTFGKQSLMLKFDNIYEFFEFLVEAKNLIENNIWNGIYFSASRKRGVKETEKNAETEYDCNEFAIEIDNRVQEILEKYIEKTNVDLEREKILIRNIIKETKESLLNLEQLGKITNLL